MASKEIKDATDSESAIERMHALTVRLEDELDKAIKLYHFARGSLENEMLGGVGYRQMAISEKDLKKLKELTVGLNSLVETQVKWDKHRKTMTTQMTPAEERGAVVKYIKSLSYEDRDELYKRLRENGIWLAKDHGSNRSAV